VQSAQSVAAPHSPHLFRAPFLAPVQHSRHLWGWKSTAQTKSKLKLINTEIGNVGEGGRRGRPRRTLDEAEVAVEGSAEEGVLGRAGERRAWPLRGKQPARAGGKRGGVAMATVGTGRRVDGGDLTFGIRARRAQPRALLSADCRSADWVGRGPRPPEAYAGRESDGDRVDKCRAYPRNSGEEPCRASSVPEHGGGAQKKFSPNVMEIKIN
jgi:hypothetical protein